MPDKKCLYKDRMKSANSIIDMDYTNKYLILVVDTEKVVK